MTDPRPTPPERVPVEDALRQWETARSDLLEGRGFDQEAADAGDALAAALEATAAERDRLASELRECDAALTEAEQAFNRVEAERDRAHLTLQWIIGTGSNSPWLMRRLARDRLENP